MSFDHFEKLGVGAFGLWRQLWSFFGPFTPLHPIPYLTPLLLNDSCRNVSINYKWEIIEDAASNFHDPKVANLLENYEKEHGYEVVVTLVDGKPMKYFCGGR